MIRELRLRLKAMDREVETAHELVRDLHTQLAARAPAAPKVGRESHEFLRAYA